MFGRSVRSMWVCISTASASPTHRTALLTLANIPCPQWNRYLRTRRPIGDSLSLQLRRGSFSTYTVKANAQFKKKDWSGFVDGEYCDSKGDYPFRYKSEYEDTVGRRSNSDICYGRIEAALFNGGFSSHLYYYESERGCPGGIVRRLSDKYVNVGREWDRDFFIQASYQKEINNHRFKVNAKYTNEYLRYCTDYPENQNTARYDNHYRQEDGYGALCYGFSPMPWLTLSTSYDIRYSKLWADLKMFENIFRLDQKQVVATQINYKGLQMAASLLHQHYHDFTNTHVGAADPIDRWTPALSVAYSLGELTLRAWYKKIFRAPTLNDLYYTQVGNRNLKPEYTKQLNIGAEYHYASRHWKASIQADIYQNKIENRIVCLPMKGTYTWTMMNYGYTFYQGLNATASGEIAYLLGEAFGQEIGKDTHPVIDGLKVLYNETENRYYNEENVPDGINSITTQTSDIWYNMHGIRIAAPCKTGIYIKNGKKVFVRF